MSQTSTTAPTHGHADAGEHPNATLARQLVDAFLRGDMGGVAAALAPDAVWEFPGDSVLNGTYVGPDEIVGFLGRSFELSGGTLSLELIDVMGSDWGATHIQRVRAGGDGRSLDGVEILSHEIRDGKIVRTYHRSDSPALTAYFGRA